MKQLTLLEPLDADNRVEVAYDPEIWIGDRIRLQEQVGPLDNLKLFKVDFYLGRVQVLHYGRDPYRMRLSLLSETGHHTLHLRSLFSRLPEVWHTRGDWAFPISNRFAMLEA